MKNGAVWVDVTSILCRDVEIADEERYTALADCDVLLGVLAAVDATSEVYVDVGEGAESATEVFEHVLVGIGTIRIVLELLVDIEINVRDTLVVSISLRVVGFAFGGTVIGVNSGKDSVGCLNFDFVRLVLVDSSSTVVVATLDEMVDVSTGIIVNPSIDTVEIASAEVLAMNVVFENATLLCTLLLVSIE